MEWYVNSKQTIEIKYNLPGSELFDQYVKIKITSSLSDLKNEISKVHSHPERGELQKQN